jgi:hypothetical protein
LQLTDLSGRPVSDQGHQAGSAEFKEAEWIHSTTVGGICKSSDDELAVRRTCACVKKVQVHKQPMNQKNKPLPVKNRFLKFVCYDEMD